MIALQSLTREKLSELLEPLVSVKVYRGDMSDAEVEAVQATKKKKQAILRASQIFQWVYQKGAKSFDEMTDLSLDFRNALKLNFEIFRLQEKFSKTSEDGTHKFLWTLTDQKTIESVLIPAPLESSNRLTLCISSQVGCAMACKFCLTGIQGLDRHLQVHEIVTQVWEARLHAPVTNIVFMGMGEPLHNIDNVVQACKILLDPMGMNFSKRKITVSTSGIVPAIETLGATTGVNLAISLNASHDEQREQIMPVNKKWNIATLLAACRKYPVGAYRRITFEYVLLSGINDSIQDADRVVKLVHGIRGKVNLIPFNEHPASEFRRPADSTVDAFHKRLLDKGVTATIRRSRGRDILAACGQLRSLFGTARGTQKHRDDAYRAQPV